MDDPSILEALRDPRMRHAAIVHLPIALSIFCLIPAVLHAVLVGRNATLRWMTVGGYALLIVSMVLAWSAFHFHRSGRWLVADLEVARRASEREAAGSPVSGPG